MNAGWLFSKEYWYQNTPSRLDGISTDLEEQLRSRSVLFIEQFRPECKSKNVILTACHLMHRFYAVQSFRGHNRFYVCASCVFLASKVEELPISLKVITSRLKALQRDYLFNSKDTDNVDLMASLLLCERLILNTLCFDVFVQLPNRKLNDLFSSVKDLLPKEYVDNVKLYWINFFADSYRTELCILYEPTVIGVSCIYLALNLSGLIHPSGENWYHVICSEFPEESIKDICQRMYRFYQKDMVEYANINEKIFTSWSRFTVGGTGSSQSSSASPYDDSSSPVPNEPFLDQCGDLACEKNPEMSSEVDPIRVSSVGMNIAHNSSSSTNNNSDDNEIENSVERKINELSNERNVEEERITKKPRNMEDS